MTHLSELESLAASCLVQAGLLNRKLGASDLTNGVTKHADGEVRDLRLSLFESVQSLLLKVAPPDFVLTQGLSASVSLSKLFLGWLTITDHGPHCVTIHQPIFCRQSC